MNDRSGQRSSPFGFGPVRGPVKIFKKLKIRTESDQKALKTGPVRIFIFFKFRTGHANDDFSIGFKHFHVLAKNLESIIRITDRITDRTNLARPCSSFYSG